MRLMKLTGSAQEADIRAGKAPSDIWDDTLRVKTYVKPPDTKYPHAVGHLDFPEPYQVAAYRLGCTWNETNPVALVQLAGCNLNCDYCYVGDHTRVNTVERSFDEVLGTYLKYREHGGVSRVLRISGGEPMLQTDEVMDLARTFTNGRQRLVSGNDGYLWIDTNLLVDPGDRIGTLADPLIGVCGCFKPHEGRLQEQFDIARKYIEAGVDIYFYWPCTVSGEPGSWHYDLPYGVDSDNYGAHVCDMLAAAVEPMAPLRTTFLHIKYGYSAMGGSDDLDGRQAAAHNFVFAARQSQCRYINHTYPPESYWQPDYMTPYAAWKELC